MRDLNNKQLQETFIPFFITMLVIAGGAYLLMQCRRQWKARIPDLQGYRFREQAIIGGGGFGVVTKCTYTTTGDATERLCAMKVLKKSDGDLKKDWQHEARRLAQLEGHRNVVRIFGADIIGEGRGRAFRIVTELIPNGSLNRHLSNGLFSSKPWVFKLQVARGVCQGVRYIHGQGIIHMDLKSDNILLGEGNVPKIADFGLARYRSHSFLSSHYRGPVGGDSRYISPECCITDEDVLSALSVARTEGAGAGYDQVAFVKAALSRVEGRITKASDMFSLGIVLWEIAVGKVTGSRSDAEIKEGAFHGDVRESKVRFFNRAITGCIKASPTDRINIGRASALFDGQDAEAGRLDAEPGCVIV